MNDSANHLTYDDIEISLVASIAMRAGANIMSIYNENIEVETKSDDTPLTSADRASHETILSGLSKMRPTLPVLSEEGKTIPYEERAHWRRFWLVDPLDGTKEFIKRNGEFTVNIALVEAGQVVAGVIFIPTLNKTYIGIKGQGAWLANPNGPPRPIHVCQPDPAKGLRVVMSRSHPSPGLRDYLKDLPVAETISVGSSLKLCVIAEGRADLYPRLGPTMEWDTAAGQALVEAAGGTVRTLEGNPLRYNKKNLLNPFFIASGG